MKIQPAKGLEQEIEQYRILEQPFFIPIQDEIDLFQTAYTSRIPVMLKGPTGCGKTRFIQYMAHQLKRPLITVACHEDLTASDLVGRYLLKRDETVWMDGPLTLSVKHGAICYLDEVVEARKDTTVIIHPLTDDRRILTVEKKGQIIEAVDEFMLVISYNPGYQSILKELKQSTKQRFISIEFNYPPADIEAKIVQQETQVPESISANLVKVGQKVRNLKNHGLEEGVSTRLLIYAAHLIHRGVKPHTACRVAIILPLTDDPEMQQSISEIVASIF